MISPASADAIVEGLIAPDVLLREQVLSRIGKSWSGERRLMLAVLEEAVTTIFRVARAVSPLGDLQKNEALAWVFSDDESAWPFSFENVCHACELNPDYVRRGINKAMAERRKVTTWMLKRTVNDGLGGKAPEPTGRFSR